MEYITYNSESFKKSRYFCLLSEQYQKEFNILTKILHFKVNNYVLDNLISWDDLENCPIYKLCFPQKGMVLDEDYRRLENRIAHSGSDGISLAALYARRKLYPPNNPDFNQFIVMEGVYHIYKKTIELFPSKASTCHSYCTYCHRWMPLVEKESRFTYSDTSRVKDYITNNPDIEDVIFSGGDPMVMSVQALKNTIDPIANIPQIKSIRIVTKSLAWWPYRYISDADSVELIDYFKSLSDSGVSVTFISHFTHAKELETEAVHEAIKKIRSANITVRCQGPIVRGINDSSQALSELWSKQVSLGLVPYYLFAEFNYGPTGYFKIPLYDILQIVKSALRNVSGLSKTIRAPVLSDNLMKVELLDTVVQDNKEKFILRCINSPDEDKVGRVFFEEFERSFVRLKLEFND